MVSGPGHRKVMEAELGKHGRKEDVMATWKSLRGISLVHPYRFNKNAGAGMSAIVPPPLSTPHFGILV